MEEVNYGDEEDSFLRINFFGGDLITNTFVLCCDEVLIWSCDYYFRVALVLSSLVFDWLFNECFGVTNLLWSWVWRSINKSFLFYLLVGVIEL